MTPFRFPLVLATLLLLLPTGVSAACQITDYPLPQADRQRLTQGLDGQWDNDFSQKMIHIRDIYGHHLHYFALQKKPAGEDHPRLLLFLHGFPEFAWAWEKQLEYFGDRYNAVALDLKGFHYSSAPTDVSGYNFVEIAREIRAVVQCLGYEKATVVGHDFGGGIAWVLGMLEPDMLDGIVVLNAPHPYLFGRELLNPDSDQRQRVQYMFYAQGTSLSDQLNFTRIVLHDTSIFDSGFYDNGRLLRLMFENWLPLSRWYTMKNYYRAMWLPPNPQDYPATLTRFQREIYTVKVPTLLLWGMADPYFSAHILDGLPDLVPDLTVVKYPGLSHWINHEAPDLNDQIERFLDRTGPDENK